VCVGLGFSHPYRHIWAIDRFIAWPRTYYFFHALYQRLLLSSFPSEGRSGRINSESHAGTQDILIGYLCHTPYTTPKPTSSLLETVTGQSSRYPKRFSMNFWFSVHSALTHVCLYCHFMQIAYTDIFTWEEPRGTNNLHTWQPLENFHIQVLLGARKYHRTFKKYGQEIP
jgi:hypothetical protein